MTSFTSSGKTDATPGGAHRRRRWFASVSGAHLLIVATGVLALVTNLVILRRGEEPLARVAVSAVELAPGRSLQTGDIELTPWTWRSRWPRNWCRRTNWPNTRDG